MISYNQTGIILSIYLKHIFVISISEISIYNSKYNAIHNVYSVVRAKEWATEIRHKLFVLTEALPFLVPLALSGSLWVDLLFSLDLTGSLTHSLAPYSPLWLSLWLPLALISSVALARHTTSLLPKIALGSPFTKKRLVSKYSAWLTSLFVAKQSNTTPGFEIRYFMSQESRNIRKIKSQEVHPIPTILWLPCIKESSKKLMVVESYFVW